MPRISRPSPSRCTTARPVRPWRSRPTRPKWTTWRPTPTPRSPCRSMHTAPRASTCRSPSRKRPQGWPCPRLPSTPPPRTPDMAESALKKALVALASAVAQGVIHDDPAATGPALVTAMLAGDPVSQHCAAELGTADTVTTVFYAKRACVVKTAGIIVTTTLAFNAAEYRTMELKVCDGAGVVGAAIATLTTVTVALTAATKRAFTLPTGGQALAAGESLRLYSTHTTGGGA